MISEICSFTPASFSLRKIFQNNIIQIISQRTLEIIRHCLLHAHFVSKKRIHFDFKDSLQFLAYNSCCATYPCLHFHTAVTIGSKYSEQCSLIPRKEKMNFVLWPTCFIVFPSMSSDVKVIRWNRLLAPLPLAKNKRIPFVPFQPAESSFQNQRLSWS